LFSKDRAYEAARRLERLGRSGKLEDIDAARTEVEQSVAQLVEELRRVRGRLA
jgi:hypothetical protein